MNAFPPAASHPVLSEATFRDLCALILEKTGIYMRDGKQILVSNRLRRRLGALRLCSYEEYYRLLASGRAGEEEMHHFIDAVSTNETYFFREMNHFNALQKTILPEILRRKPRVRIWSAGCSTGEEAYTLRIVVDEALGGRGSSEVAVIGTDISTRVVASAREGLYKERALRLVPQTLRDRYFSPAGEGDWKIREDVRARVDFRVHNLFEDPAPGSFDIIFCRNVMIYFDKPTQTRLADGIFASALEPDGYLFIGHAESLSGSSRKFRYASGFKAPIYRMTTEAGS